jgi:hypothetical protein
LQRILAPERFKSVHVYGVTERRCYSDIEIHASKIAGQNLIAVMLRRVAFEIAD